MTGDQTNPTITISPDPPVQCGTMTVGYDGPPGTVLKVDFGTSGTVKVTIGPSGTVDVDVPCNATSVIISGGGAQPVSEIIEPMRDG